MREKLIFCTGIRETSGGEIKSKYNYKLFTKHKFYAFPGI